MTKEGRGYSIKSVLVCILFFIAFSTTFVHLFFNKRTDWKPYKENNYVYDSIVSSSQNSFNVLLNQFENNQIDKATYIKSLKNVNNNKKEILKKYHSNKEQLKEEFSFMGCTSTRYFLYALGFALFGLTVSTLLLTVVLRLEDQIQHKRIFIFGCVGFIYISAFWTCHTLFATVDLPVWSYNISFVLLTILVTAIIYDITTRYTDFRLKKLQEKKDIEEILATSHKFLDLVEERANKLFEDTDQPKQ